MSDQINTCPVCTSEATKHWATIDGFLFNRCNACQHLYVASPVTEEMLDRAYGNSYYGAEDSANDNRCGYDDYLRNADKRLAGFKNALIEIERFSSPPGRLLDFGCAVGLFVRAAADRGWNAIGYDRSDWATTYGRDHFHVDLRSGPVPNFEPNSFDLISLWDCIEHLPDPQGALSRITAWLRPGGILVVQTVNSSSYGARLAGKQWRHIAPPLHLHLFSAHSLDTSLYRNDLIVIHKRALGVFLGAKLTAKARSIAVSLVDDLVCHWRLGPIATALNLKDELMLVARKQM